jgi:hypothetical protein
MVERVFIQKKNGEFVSVNGYAAWHGFDQKAFPITFFEWPQLRDGQLDLTPNTLVVGGVATVLNALKRLGKDTPPIDYPEPLRPFLGREMQPTTMGAVRGMYESEGSPPRFVKPRQTQKAFTGYVVSAFHDLIPTARHPDDLPVWSCETVEFVSEWRYFVLRNAVIGVGHYRGDVFTRPDTETVRAAVEAFKGESPAACAIDFGVTCDGRTLLVEVNDAYSLGHLGLRSVQYVNMLEARWVELMTTRSNAV